MMSQMVAYDNMTGSSLLVSLSLSYLQFGSGCWLKASAALLVLPDIYIYIYNVTGMKTGLETK